MVYTVDEGQFKRWRPYNKILEQQAEGFDDDENDAVKEKDPIEIMKYEKISQEEMKSLREKIISSNALF